LRVFACRAEAGHPETPAVGRVLDQEGAAGLDRPEGYEGFEAKVRAVREALLAFLAGEKAAGRLVAGYGAAAKGNTLLNYCGAGPEEIAFVVDRNPAKQGALLPGSRIPVLAPDALMERRPASILILPWNLKTEIKAQLAAMRGWGGRFVTAIPRLEVD
jgi:hypothetical protein